MVSPACSTHVQLWRSNQVIAATALLIVLGGFLTPLGAQAEDADVWPAATTPIPLPVGDVDSETGRLIGQILTDDELANVEGRKALRAMLQRRVPNKDGKTANTPPTATPWEQYPASLKLLKELSGRAGLEISWPFDPKVPGPNISSLISLSLVGLLRAHWHLDHGRIEAAAKDLKDVLSLGLLLESAKGGLINNMVGIAISRTALEQAVSMIPRLNDTELKGLQVLLAAHGVRPAWVGPVLAYEQHTQEHWFETMRNWTVGQLLQHAGPSTGGRLQKSLSKVGAHLPVPRSLYDADKTIAFSRHYWRLFIEAAKKDPAKRVLPRVPKLRTGIGHLFDNPVGRILLSVAMPNFQKYLVREDRLRCYRRMVLLRASVALFKRANGRFPPNLDALVPTFLSSLPVDLFAYQRTPGTPNASFTWDPTNRHLGAETKAERGMPPAGIQW